MIENFVRIVFFPKLGDRQLIFLHIDLKMENNLNANPFVAENGGLCDETLEIFREFMTMVTVTSMHPGIDLECAICLNILFVPHELEVCKHVFCYVCIIRLFQATGPSCPLCRAVFRFSDLLFDLHKTIKIYFDDEYLEKLYVELESGILEDYRNHNFFY